MKTQREVPCYLAEFIGTFAIVLFGCGAIATIADGPSKHLAVNVAFGLTVAVMIYCLGHISRAHFNPAVTLGFMASGRFPVKSGLAYIFAQCLGAVAAAGVLRVLLPDASLGATIPSLPLFPSLLLEALLTFFLVLVIAGSAVDRRAAPGLAGAAIGATVLICGLFAGPLTGNSLNPARSLGPALFSGGAALSHLWIYLLGPVVGGVAAVKVYQMLAKGDLPEPNRATCC